MMLRALLLAGVLLAHMEVARTDDAGTSRGSRTRGSFGGRSAPLPRSQTEELLSKFLTNFKNFNVTCQTVCNCSCAPSAPPLAAPAPACPPCVPSPCPTPTPSPPRRLPSGYAVQPKLIYKFYGCDNHTSWDDANSTCVHGGGYLAVPHTMSEIYLLVGMLKLHRSSRGDPCTSLHVGFHDKDVDGIYQSVLDLPMNEFAHSQWASGEPRSGTDDLCVILDDNGLFSNEDCEEDNAFTCVLKSD